ncbi:MAG: hypothetical protein NC184_06555 [Roseburia sp.]|nr:hypothetical protein [Roseburia sp.]
MAGKTTDPEKINDAEKPKAQAAKKPAAKKQTASSTSKTTAAKKPATKKPTASATKKQTASAPKTAKAKPPVESEPQNEQPEAAAEVAASEPPVQPAAQEAAVEQAVVTEQPTAEETPAEEKPAEQAPVSEAAAEQEPKAEEPAVAAEVEEPQKAEKPKTKSGSKVGRAIDKAKLPIFIIVNALLAVSAVLLLISAFDISIDRTGSKSEWFSLFGYFSKGDTVKGYLALTALNWASGAYAVIGILMVLAVVLPLALVVKNVILLLVKKNKDVHTLDAVIAFAFMIAYLAFVNLYGANMTAGHLIALIISAVLLAFSIFMSVLFGHGKLPLFSIVNLVLTVLCMFMLCATPILKTAKGTYYGASAAVEAGGAGGFMFVMLIVAIVALVAFSVMQFKKLPKLLEIIVPAVLVVAPLIALICAAAGKPDGFDLGGGFVFGTILTLVIAVVNVLFAVLKPLGKFKNRICDLEKVAIAAEEAVAEEPQAPVAAPEAGTAGKVFCTACGAQNNAGDMFCCKCGQKLN